MGAACCLVWHLCLYHFLKSQLWTSPNKNVFCFSGKLRGIGWGWLISKFRLFFRFEFVLLKLLLRFKSYLCLWPCAFCVKMISYGNSVKTCIFQLFKCGSPIACMSVKKKKIPTCSMKELLGGTPDGIALWIDSSTWIPISFHTKRSYVPVCVISYVLILNPF